MTPKVQHFVSELLCVKCCMIKLAGGGRWRSVVPAFADLTVLWKVRYFSLSCGSEPRGR